MKSSLVDGAWFSRRRLVPMVLLGTLACLLIASVWRAVDRPDPIAEPPVSGLAERDHDAPELALPDAGQDRGVAASSPSDRPEAAVGEPDGGEVEVWGSVRTFDQHGTYVPSVRGHVRWEVLRSDGSSDELVKGIEDDVWSLSAPSDAILRPVDLLWSDGVLSVKTEIANETIPVSHAVGHEIVAHLRYGFVLNALDRETRSHLEDVDVVLAVATDQPFRDSVYPPATFLEQPRFVKTQAYRRASSSAWSRGGRDSVPSSWIREPWRTGGNPPGKVVIPTSC